MNTIAYAMGTMGQTGTTGAAGGGMSGLMGMFLPLIIIFAIFWLLLIRPQQKKMKKHQEFVSNLKKGDEVITSSGLYGKIAGVSNNAITLEIAEGVKVKIEKAHVSGYTAQSQPVSAEKVGNTGK
ncbi:MAG: preprotein translocase subunit YajC [Deltaproteobacteria bacterium]|nr:preprotein translocase subunit YajC [Deltaproteobacteria bacterium]